MLLAIDVGNTNVTIGVFDGDRLAHSWRLAALRERTGDELGILITRLFEQAHVPVASVTGIAVASVVPPLTRPMEEMSQRYFSHTALVVDATNAGMPVHYTPAGDVGADRIVNAVAAWDKYGRAAGRPLIVVDFGTGTTFDVISPRGEYLGGIICPGINISAEALFTRAARLPRVEVRKPAHAIGRNTVDAMQAGLFFGYVEMVDGLVRRIRAELAEGEKAVVLATGGLADVISGESATIQHVDPNLTLDGLRLIWERRGSSWYCREIESYLCKKNEGHLIRIVGPVFEKVCGWAAQGVPLAVAFKGIDQYCERYYAKGPRRRPVRVEFCEADVLELFDDWRRAVGVPSAGGDDDGERKQDSLPAHLDRAIARLTALRAGERSQAFGDRLDGTVRELDRLKPLAKSARGDARTAILDRLVALDVTLLDVARAELTDVVRAELRRKAETEIAPFAARMTAEARSAAVDAAFTRLLRESIGVPTLTLS